ncbi:hypothetical protein [Corynebacterium pseudopelargi]|uniref:Uncharacterized protein n=1 Tax=Corynebacterium pseudopelargi TaxID=2080757 RepID=A0A3G6IX23_9CORY|nr:hypothetical protein [Corynebacterium pseudopelargi]AZA08504.1 hypothetical protein CPPEL_01790 [Corynebacterium pseudopelargi]
MKTFTHHHGADTAVNNNAPTDSTTPGVLHLAAPWRDAPKGMWAVAATGHAMQAGTKHTRIMLIDREELRRAMKAGGGENVVICPECIAADVAHCAEVREAKRLEREQREAEERQAALDTEFERLIDNLEHARDRLFTTLAGLTRHRRAGLVDVLLEVGVFLERHAYRRATNQSIIDARGLANKAETALMGAEQQENTTTQPKGVAVSGRESQEHKASHP